VTGDQKTFSSKSIRNQRLLLLDEHPLLLLQSLLLSQVQIPMHHHSRAGLVEKRALLKTGELRYTRYRLNLQ
jgi:cell division protein FtsL